MRPRPVLPSRSLQRTAVALTLAAGTACSSAVGTFGADATASAKAEAFFGALAARFGVAYRDARFEAIRPRMVRHALTPSRLYPDATIWTSTEGGVHTVSIAGTLVRTPFGDRYILAARPTVPPPVTPGESRHVMHLRRVADAVYRWDSTDEVAVGHATAEEIFTMLGALLRGAERPADRIEADYRASFPRTTATLERLFELDTLRTTPETDGSTTIFMTARLDPNRMRPFAPRYADYIDEYLKPLRIEISLIDERGRSWGTVGVRRNVLQLRIRVRSGALQPLAGGIASLSDSLRLRGSFFAKVLFLDVGATNILADVARIRETHIGGWSLRFRREPQWHFPLAVSRLLRAPLRRPFAGDGVRLEFVARETETGQTVLARNIGITVQESAIVRWLGGLGATAMGDLSILAEQEKDRYVGDVFRALAEDSRAILSP